MKIILFLLLLVLSICNEEETFLKFQQFIKKYDKKYNSLEEFMARYIVFSQSLHNLINSSKKLSYKKGITKFSDMTEQEFLKIYGNLEVTAFALMNPNPANFIPNGKAPDSLNFIEQGYLQDVRDQGSCGSCFAFTSVANIEGQYYKKYGKNKEFSQQQIVDCDYINSGCNGGLMEYTFTYLQKTGGIESYEDYPYVGVEQTCKADKSKFDPDVVIAGWEKLGNKEEIIDPADEDDMKEYLYEKGPLAIIMNSILLREYTGGIIDVDESQCSTTRLNHAVTLVGYGTENDVPYWIIRNSFGKDWGENGYFRIYRGKGVCGINKYVVTVVLG